jgi:phosphate-selective porin OprO and OprP
MDRSVALGSRATAIALLALLASSGSALGQSSVLPSSPELPVQSESPHRSLPFKLPSLNPTSHEAEAAAATAIMNAPEKMPSTPANSGPAPLPEPKPLEAIDRKLNVTWDGGGFRYKNSDGSFTLHLGGRLMTDEVWFNQSPNLRLPAVPPANSSLAQRSGVGAGIGDLMDGAFVRRARFVADGTVFKTIDFKTEFDFESYNSVLFDESYVGVRSLPWIGMVRLGQSHVPFGLEAYTSSRYLPMLERSPLFDAFFQEFGPGIFANTTFFDERLTMQHMFHRIDNFSQFNGASFGDGKYAYSGRLSTLPLYDDDGRNLVHLGLAYQFRKGSTPLDFNGGTVLPSNPAVTDNTDLFRFRAQQSLRDAVGLQGDNSRVVDTGNLIADHAQQVNGELMWYRGSFWAQSETTLAHVSNVVFPAAANATARGSLNFWGSYIMCGYFLTGEQRGYDKPMGKYGRVVPKTNFILIRDKDGQIQSGPGAWELLYRYSYLDLDDRSIQGGKYGEHTMGVNWYWNSNVKIQFNYLIGQRVVPEPASNGIVQGFGVRGSLEF